MRSTIAATPPVKTARRPGTYAVRRVYSQSAPTPTSIVAASWTLPRKRWTGRPLENGSRSASGPYVARPKYRSEEHTSELQSRSDLVCRLLLEKKKNVETRH